MRPTSVRLAATLTRWSFGFRRGLAIIAAAILLLLLLDAWLSARGDAQNRQQLESVERLAMADPSVVDAARALVAFTLREVNTPPRRSEGRYVAEGLRHVAATIDALARRDTAGPLHVEVATALGRSAEALEHESDDEVRSSIARAAFISTAGSVAALQEHRFPHLSQAVAEVYRAASRVRPNELLATQRTLVDEFFVVTSDALVAMTWRSL